MEIKEIRGGYMVCNAFGQMVCQFKDIDSAWDYWYIMKGD